VISCLNAASFGTPWVCRTRRPMPYREVAAISNLGEQTTP
jgi:hypothetical protein